MRTLEGMQALDAAKRYGITVYDTYYDNEISVEEAEQFIESRRDPAAFVLKDWPETEEEAEDIVLMRIYRALSEEHTHSGMIEDVMEEIPGPVMNLAAAELAALRLGTRNILEVQDREDGVFYHVPRTTHLTREFVSKLSEYVCDECAHLRLDGAYHEPCLHSLIDAIRRGQFAFEDIVEERDADGDRGIARLLPGLGRLGQRVSEAKSRLQNFVKSSKSAGANAKGATRPRPTEPDPDWPDLVEPDPKPLDVANAERDYSEDRRSQVSIPVDEPTIAHPASSSMSSTSMSSTPPVRPTSDASSRVRMTKRDLLAYLESIEIVDESGDLLAQLEAYEKEYEALEARFAEERRARSETERDRDYWKEQYEDLKTDMDKLVEALQIAQRRTERERNT